MIRKLASCVFISRNFTHFGAGVHVGTVTLTMRNTIVALNHNGLHHWMDPPTLTFHNSIFYNPAGEDILWDTDPGIPDLTADGNRIVDPMFVDPNQGDYELAAGSPAIDSAHSFRLLRTDLLGRPRQDDSGVPNTGVGYPCYVDLGAFERQDDSCGSTPIDTPSSGIGTGWSTEDQYGPIAFIASDAPLNYRIEFRNDPGATTCVWDVVIVEQLDPARFDLDTLDITSVGLLQWNATLGGPSVDTQIDCEPEMNVAVQVKAGLGMQVPGLADGADIDANTLVVWLHAIDPSTGNPPTDPRAGFLPPLDPETRFETGWVEYSIDPIKGLASGTKLETVAYVEYDFTGDLYDHPAPKTDPNIQPVEPRPWINTIDAAGPTSHVETLAETTESDLVTIRWNGQDDEGGSGIASYDIFVSTDRGPLETWLDGTTHTEALFAVSPGHRYEFFSQATDVVGNTEASPASTQAMVIALPIDSVNAVVQTSIRGVDETLTLVHGRIDSIPSFGTSIDEWKPFYIDVWVQCMSETHQTGTVSLEMSYMTELTSLSSEGISYGELFSEYAPPTIDDETGYT